jgi:hypothetical protein
MAGKTLFAIRKLARREAERRGHEIKQWNRHRTFRYSVICERCGADLMTYSEAIEKAGRWLEFENAAGMIVARDQQNHLTIAGGFQGGRTHKRIKCETAPATVWPHFK